MGNNYHTQLNWNMGINDHFQKCTSEVVIAKDGALDRMFGSITGLGSHPGRHAYPNNMNILVKDICEKINSVLQELR